MGSVLYLEDEGCSVAGLRLWGSPYSHGSSANSAFQSRPDERLESIRGEDLDILITHGPLSDSTVRSLNPRLHVSGHIHGRYGVHCAAKLFASTLLSWTGDIDRATVLLLSIWKCGAGAPRT